jgi:transposase
MKKRDRELEFRRAVVVGVLRRRITKKKAAQATKRSVRTIERWTKGYLGRGDEALRDKRTSNYRKLTEKEERQVVVSKLKGKHRSARFIRDQLKLPVHEETVRLILVKHHLNPISLPPVKRIERFEAREPNDLWQIDLMGKAHFPLVGDLPLIATIDDHSRFVHYGRFFYRKFRINVFMVMYEAFVRCGLPRSILSDRASQFRATHPKGEADYQYYAKNLGINLIYAQKARTKGKIEAFWRFVQRDFVMEHIESPSIESLNDDFGNWLEDFNFSHSHKGIMRQCPADLYVESQRKLTSEELEFILVHEEPRKVMRTASISYYGHHYRVPEQYIGRRVWTKLKGNTMAIECGGEVIARHKVREARYQDVPRTDL